MWGGDGVMLYAQINPISTKLDYLLRCSGLSIKNSSYLSIKERKGDQSDIYLPS